MVLPEKVVVGCTEFRVTEAEGRVMFSETPGLALGAFKSRVSFTRDDDGGWSVSIDQGSGHISMVIGLYRVVEREYGANAGDHLTSEEKASDRDEARKILASLAAAREAALHKTEPDIAPRDLRVLCAPDTGWEQSEREAYAEAFRAAWGANYDCDCGLCAFCNGLMPLKGFTQEDINGE